MVFSMALSQPLPKRQMHETELWLIQDVQCIPSTPWPRNTILAPALQSSLRSAPVLTTGNWAPDPSSRIKHSSLSHWELWEYLRGSLRYCSKVLLFFLETKLLQTGTRATSSDHDGICSSPCSLAPSPQLQFAALWASCSSQDFLAVLCPITGWAARDGSFFCHPYCKPSKLQSIPFGLPHGHRMGLLPTKAWETHTEASPWKRLDLSPLCLKK